MHLQIRRKGIDYHKNCCTNIMALNDNFPVLFRLYVLMIVIVNV